MLTQNVTVIGHYLSLCEVLLVSALVSSDVVVLSLQMDLLVPLNSLMLCRWL